MFYHYPAQHWQHIRSTNPIESAFSTVSLRTQNTRGQGTMATTLVIVFKLAERDQLIFKCLDTKFIADIFSFCMNQLIGGEAVRLQETISCRI